MIFQCITLEFDKYFIVTGSKNFIMCLAFIATSLGVSLCIFMYTYVDRMRVNVFIDRIHTIFRVIYIFSFFILNSIGFPLGRAPERRRLALVFVGSFHVTQEEPHPENKFVTHIDMYVAFVKETPVGQTYPLAVGEKIS